MAGQLIQLVSLGAGDLGDAGGDGVFCLKAVVCRAGGVVAFKVHLIHVIVGKDGVVFPADQHDTAGGGTVILLGKGRVKHRIPLLPAKVAALTRIAVKQAGDVGVLLSALGQIVGGYIGV